MTAVLDKYNLSEAGPRKNNRRHNTKETTLNEKLARVISTLKNRESSRQNQLRHKRCGNSQQTN